MGFERIPTVTIKPVAFAPGLLARLTRFNDLRDPWKAAEKGRHFLTEINQYIHPRFGLRA